MIFLANDTFSKLPLFSRLVNDGYIAAKIHRKRSAFFPKPAYPRVERTTPGGQDLEVEWFSLLSHAATKYIYRDKQLGTIIVVHGFVENGYYYSSSSM